MVERHEDEQLIQAPPSGPGPMLMAIGPGLVVSGAVIGSGELINIPLQAATFGFTLFWGVMGQYINGLVNTPLIMFGICWIAFRTDRRLRMSRLTAILLLMTVAVILGCLLVGICA